MSEEIQMLRQTNFRSLSARVSGIEASWTRALPTVSLIAKAAIGCTGTSVGGAFGRAIQCAAHELLAQFAARNHANPLPDLQLTADS
jgi:hypothetical protein